MGDKKKLIYSHSVDFYLNDPKKKKICIKKKQFITIFMKNLRSSIHDCRWNPRFHFRQATKQDLLNCFSGWFGGGSTHSLNVNSTTIE